MTVSICPFTRSLTEQSQTLTEKSHSPLFSSLTCGFLVLNMHVWSSVWLPKLSLYTQRTIHAALTEDWPPHIHHAGGRPAVRANDMTYTAGWSRKTLPLSLVLSLQLWDSQSRYCHRSWINSLLCAFKTCVCEADGAEADKITLTKAQQTYLIISIGKKIRPICCWPEEIQFRRGQKNSTSLMWRTCVHLNRWMTDIYLWDSP